MNQSSLRHKVYKNLLVFFQFAGIAIIVLTGNLFAENAILLVIEILGILLAIWALASMKLSNLNVYPSIKKDAKMVKSGPYKIIRHPMYSSIIISVLPLVIDQFSLFRLIVYVVMLLDLIIKLNYEENLLKAHFENYVEYSKSTYRIMPFIY